MLVNPHFCYTCNFRVTSAFPLLDNTLTVKGPLIELKENNIQIRVSDNYKNL